ncbi:methylmalonyl-CoA mutase family protein [Rufibacter glacialis]|uniref:Methylmalonyl-CoA mutase n=1 Tax=Rufibacter glacialis TaxID=1259555 RepID=A0A5M8QI47_9BACT|nr:methylmalonyl-CoA mutase family protein [Rufibacter glacialis]KAA6435715.1 methylmalonyl-CoA mutase [Rufibacter glacialis]GGK65911.1 methylmalonyl-CoA mutase small subunit [Rufibacter glacialis]
MTDKSSEEALFPEFGPVTAAQWTARVTQDLKGTDPADLQWQSYEGISVAPFYTREDLPQNPALDTRPGQSPFVRTAKTQKNQWLNLQAIHSTSKGHKAVDKAVSVLTRGVDGIHFILENGYEFDCDYLIEHIDLTQVPVSYTVSSEAANFLHHLVTGLYRKGLSLGQLNGFLKCAPILSSESYKLLDMDHVKHLLEQSLDADNFYALTINGSHFSNKGATLVQEIAITLAIAVCYTNGIRHEVLPEERIFRNMQFHLTAGTNYFFEIAKLRAVRLLWAKVVEAYGAPQEAAGALRIHVSTSRWHQATLDPHTNLLRHTTQMMSAIIGGADSVEVEPFDSTFKEDNAFSERIARNIPIILREEAYLDQAIDPAAGSYYLEYLTQQIAEKAWALFQEIEGKGGFIPASNAGFIQDLIKETTNQKFKDIASGKEVILGTNKFPNPNEQHEFDPEKLIQSKKFDNTRAAYSYEVMRLATELHFRKKKRRPHALVVHMGKALQEHIHASFAREFFTCSGFTTQVLKFDNVSAALTGVKELDVQVIVMAAPDQQFQEFAEAFAKGMRAQQKQGPALILADDPMSLKDELRGHGFDEFLFQGCDTKEIITRIQERLGA